MLELERSIECGKQWKNSYVDICKIQAKLDPKRPWNFAEGSIFAQVDAFVQRCSDLLDICEGQLQFSRHKSQPVFGGSKGVEIMKSISEIKETFLLHIDKLRAVNYDLLDVKATKWHDDYSAFKNHMKDLEVMWINVINSALESVSTVSMGLELLDGFFLLARREKVRHFVEKKAADVCGLFMSDLNNVKREFEQFRKKPSLPIVQRFPSQAGAALWARGLLLRLSRQFNDLELLEFYVEPSPEQTAAADTFSNLKSLLETFVMQSFGEWTQEVKNLDEEDLPRRLNQPLLCRPEEGGGMQKAKGGLLENNFDKGLLKMFNEIYYWEKIQGSGIVVPYAAHEMATHREALRVIREHVMRVVREYNVILNSLSPEERKIFNHHIRTLDRKVGAGLTKYTWTSGGVKEYYVRDSCKECAKILDYVREFKASHQNLLGLCKSISDKQLLRIERKKVYRHDEFKQLQADHKIRVEAFLQSHYQQIIEQLLKTYKQFEAHPGDVQRDWRGYCDKIDKRVEEALKKAMKTSLQDLCRALNGDSKQEPAPLFKINAILDATRMDFHPNMNQLKDLLQTVCRDMTMTLTILPRVFENFRYLRISRDKERKAALIEAGDSQAANAIHIPSEEEEANFRRQIAGQKSYFEEISKDEECVIRFVKEILKGFNACAVKVGERLKWWNSSYQTIVSQDKDSFMKRYARTERTLQAFGDDIQKYRTAQSEIQQEEYKVMVGFLETDFTNLKADLLVHCQEWQTKFTGLLNHNARTEMDAILKYFESTSKVLVQEPKTFDDLRDRLALIDRCKQDDESTENRISPVEAQYAKLQEFEVQPADEELFRLASLRPKLEDFRQTMVLGDGVVGSAKNKLKGHLENLLTNFSAQVKDTNKEFQSNAPFSCDKFSNEAAQVKLEMYEEQLQNTLQHEASFKNKLELFGMEAQSYKELETLQKDLNNMKAIWDCKKNWDSLVQSQEKTRFRELNVDDMETRAQDFHKQVRAKSAIRQWPIWQYMKNAIDTFRNTMPLVTNLRSEAMRERHWEAIISEVGVRFDPESPDFTFGSLLSLELHKHSELIARLSDEAGKEFKIEVSLRDIRQVWGTMALTLEPYKDRDNAYRLKTSEEMFQALEENILTLSSMKSSQFYIPFAEQVEYWEKTLANISEVIEMVLVVQRGWMYLENIFVGSEDIKTQLVNETKMFEEVDKGYSDILGRMASNPKAVEACSPPGLLDKLTQFSETLDKIQKSLDDYLEKKRQQFPRFYFLSNDDLLEILGQAKDPEQVQKHIKKCFEGIKILDIVAPTKEKGQRAPEAAGMISPDGEAVKFSKNVALEPPVEGWLNQVEARMKETLRKLLNVTHQENVMPKGMKKEKWVKTFPGQLLITSGQIGWTTDCQLALAKVEKGQKNAMKQLKKAQTKYIAKLTDLIRKPLSKVERNKLVALITIEVHARDVQDRLVQTKTDNPAHFNWMSQLRFELREPSSSHDQAAAMVTGQASFVCWVLQTNTFSPYGYEYQGNNGRLVITPMTDRCYMTLTTAMHLKRGGAPQGPAGTGKTESVKDLGKGMAKYVIVFNCSDGLDYKSLGRMFSGLAQAGAWGCFDEFNRIEVEVLSVVAAQILTIQAAMREEKKEFLFEERIIPLDAGCAVFITMNPGYAGRSELPDNLKSLFRPVAMMVPDLGMIAEIMLVSEGFKEFKPLAKKMITLYQMMVQQMSKQDHYDFGLRSLKSVLNCAGGLKRTESDLSEAIILMRAINDMNAPKWVSQDVPLYEALLGDIFPGLELPEPDYGKLEEAIRESLRAAGLQEAAHSVAKCIHTYETKMTRHGNMLVGASLGGKTTAWRSLADAKTRMNKAGIEGFEKVLHYIINPKSITMDELYGAYELSTMEWTDGILSSIMRAACQDPHPHEKWLILDGPVDTLWIESMNTVLDDNKVLTLINGDRISMPNTVSLLFEVEDLSVASPATVSRAGMVYFDVGDLGWRPLLTSWITGKLPIVSGKQQTQDFLFNLSEKWLPKCLKIRHDPRCKELVPISDSNAVMSFCRLFDIFGTKVLSLSHGEIAGEKAAELTEKIFVFCVVWSLGASVSEPGRLLFDQTVREIENIFPPQQTVYEYCLLNLEKSDFTLWEERLPHPFKPPEGAPFHKIIVPTVDTIRNLHILTALSMNHQHVLLVGNTGTGKTVAVQQIISGLDEASWTSLAMNFSAQTSSLMAQQIIEGKVEKRIKNKFGPPGNRRMLCFVDDLNMPRKDLFGSQPPLELLRQWMDYGCWYDRQKQTLRYILDIQLACGMGPPGGGRAVISRRLQSNFNLICLTNPSDAQVKRIYLTLCAHKLSEFREEVKSLAEPLTQATMSIYAVVGEKFLPTPSKCHYLFNLRDVSKVFQGIYLARPSNYEEKDQMLKLWLHEVCRIFQDRLISYEDRTALRHEIDVVLDTQMQMRIKEISPGEHDDLVFAPISLRNPDAEEPPYDQMADKKELKNFMENKLEQFNDFFKGKQMDIVMFKDAIEHCMRILRLIQLARGNALLVGVGGSGRHCQARMASFISDYDCFQIVIDKSYRHAQFRDDLKALYEKTGVQGKPVTFLFSDTEIVTESFLEDVSNILSSGEVPNLYPPDELNAVRASLEKPAKAAGVPFGPEPLYDFLLSRVRENLHVVFCMSPIGDSFRNYCRMYPSLVNCTTTDWFLPWPAEALQEVANKFLMEGGVDDALRDSVATVFGKVHISVAVYSDWMLEHEKRHNYVTPSNYLELVQGYVATLKEKENTVGGSADKLRNGLGKLMDARQQVETMSVDLEIKQEVVETKQRECQELLVTIVEDRMKAEEAEKQVQKDKVRIQAEEEETKILAEDAERDLAKAMPALEASVDALEKLDKKSIAEVKAYAKPPEMVMKTLSAVMTVMEKAPTWAQAKQELNDVNFLQRVKNFDKDNISNATLKKVEKYTKDELFTPQAVGKVSAAAGALCLWVHAMKTYAEVYREVEPKRMKLKTAMETLERKQAQMQAAIDQLTSIQNKLDLLKKQYDESMAEKDALTSEAELLKTKLDRAEKLVTGLAGEKDRWENSLGSFDQRLNSLPGDCLVSAAFMSYAGPFGADLRDRLCEVEWRQPSIEHDIPCSAEFKFDNFMADPTDVRQWNLQGLPTDRFSTENGVLVTQGRRWPLMIDPQNQANKWIKSMEAKRDLKVFDPNTPNFMRSVELAIEWGKPCLMENVVEELDPSLEPVLAKNIINRGGSLSIQIGDKTLDYNIDFKFYLTTKMANPHYTPEVSTKTTIVNFVVVEEGLASQLLGVVVMKEEPKLEETKNELVVKVSTGKNRLVELENEILRMLNEATGSLLDDLDLINTLNESKEISKAVTEQVAEAEQTMIRIDAARQNYLPCGKRAAVLFFVLNDLVTVDPMYQFALDAYVDQFIISIDKSAEKYVVGSVEERVEVLNSYHTLAIYRYACRALFERHKLLLSLHIASKVLMAQGELNMQEYLYFVKGGQVLSRDSQTPNPSSDWITTLMWDNITELERNTSDAFSGFQSAFEQSLRDWKKWYMTAEPEREPLPGEWDSRLDALQKLIVVRCIRTDRSGPAIANFVATKFDKSFVEPPNFDLETIYDDSTPQGPLIFVLTPGMDPTPLLRALASSRNLQWQSISLGQGQAPKAKKMLIEGVSQGFWVFLANCHLSLTWLPDLDKLVDQYMLEKKPHPNFRLWMSSDPTPRFPITLLQRCVKMTTEPPKGLKANMLRMLTNLTDQQFQRVKEIQKYKRLVFSLVWYHAILLERKKFKTLGWNVAYDFNDSDFEICENILAMYLDEYPSEIPWDAIRYLIAEANYGGRVTEAPDNRLLRVYVNQFFCSAALQPKFCFSTLPTYGIPDDPTLSNLRNYVKDLPMIEPPEAFGQHVNAEIASALADVDRILETIMGIMPSGGEGGEEGESNLPTTKEDEHGGAKKGPSKDDHVLAMCDALLEQWPQDLDYQDILERNENDTSPLKTVLLQEIERYNELLQAVRKNIHELKKGIAGIVVISEEQEKVMTAVFDGKVPAAWTKAYPSIKPLSTWIVDLIGRIEQLTQWGMFGTPKVFWLGGFTYPTSFLTALLQLSARKNMVSVDTLSFDFVVQTSQEEGSVSQPPKEGAYISRMILEGAKWDLQHSSLADPEPMALYAAMPIVHFKPVSKKRSPLAATGEAGAGMEPGGIYQCPLYLYPVRTGTRERPSFMIWVDLKAGQYDHAYWTKRGTALLLAIA